MAAPLSRAEARILRAALAARQAEDEAARLAARADAFVSAFVDMTPAQVIAYVNANVNNVADAKVLLTKMALMLLLLARKEYK